MENVCTSDFEIKPAQAEWRITMDTRIIVRKALENGLVIPAFNIPHPPMLKAIAQAMDRADADAFRR